MLIDNHTEFVNFLNVMNFPNLHCFIGRINLVDLQQVEYFYNIVQYTHNYVLPGILRLIYTVLGLNVRFNLALTNSDHIKCI